MGYMWMNYKPPTKWDAHPSKYGKPMLNILYGKLWYIHIYIYVEYDKLMSQDKLSHMLHVWNIY
jgi:hypothetical protein